jgi:hypothetical protein
MTRRLGLSTAVTATLAAALTTLGAPSAIAADPAYQAPVVGQCFDMSAEELAGASYAEAAVDCAAEHTSEVIAVAQMPDGLTYDDSAALTTFALETCYPAQRKVLGTSKLGVRLTAFNVGYFGPTAEQQAAGARWLRCDLVLNNGDKLLPLPGRLKVGTYPFSAKVARCLAGRDFHITVCAKKHTFRATAALKVDKQRYPSEKAWKRIGTERCRGATSSRSYRFSWPSKIGWKVGDHTLVCYSQTRH